VPELRCNSKKFGEVTTKSTGIFEAICTSRFCKTRQDEVILHKWDLRQLNPNGSIKMIETKRFKRPAVRGNKE
jgi:hypothetical protein